MDPEQVILGPEIKVALRSIGCPSTEDDVRIKYSIRYYESLVNKRALEMVLWTDESSGGWSRLMRKGMLQSAQQWLEAARYTSASLRSLLSPIRRLPPEILSDIFILCLPNHTFITPSRLRAPLLLLRISKAWRDIALATPQLWSSLALRESNKKRHNNVASMMRFWLSQTGESPLSLSIRDELLESEVIRGLFNGVSRQWRHIHLQVPDTAILFLEPSQGCPLLEDFTLHTPWDLNPSQARSVSLALQQAPQLRSFVWQNDIQFGRATAVDFHCSHLTCLSLDIAVTLQECLDILQQSPNLTDVSFQNLVRPAEEVVARPQITLRKLQSLVFGGQHDISSCLAYLCVPLLRELALNVRCWPHSALLSLLRRSQCPLESLNIYFPIFSELELIECLEVTQSTLREFTLQIGDRSSSATITAPILDRLTYKLRGQYFTCLCPHLELIALYNCVSCFDGRLEAMIRSRLEFLNLPTTDPCYVAKMKVVEISNEETYLSRSLKPLREEGLILKIYSPRTGRLIKMTPEDTSRLAQLRAEGLTLRVYNPSSGRFVEVTDLD